MKFFCYEESVSIEEKKSATKKEKREGFDLCRGKETRFLAANKSGPRVTKIATPIL